MSVFVRTRTPYIYGGRSRLDFPHFSIAVANRLPSPPRSSSWGLEDWHEKNKIINMYAYLLRFPACSRIMLVSPCQLTEIRTSPAARGSQTRAFLEGRQDTERLFTPRHPWGPNCCLLLGRCMDQCVRSHWEDVGNDGGKRLGTPDLHRTLWSSRLKILLLCCRTNAATHLSPGRFFVSSFSPITPPVNFLLTFYFRPDSFSNWRQMAVPSLKCY